MLCGVLLVLCFASLSDIIEAQSKTYIERTYPATVREDGLLETPQLLRKYNYPAETHSVTTEDGYVLTMHRIPNPGRRPVFLMHGLADCSSVWIFMGPWMGLGYFLHDNGYDVWMGNARGTRYSRNHTTYNPDIDITDFWSFSWHEIGLYDLPAMIDYVLYVTGYPRLGYIGHSQGTTVFWVMASMRPAYNAKITIMHALAPVAYGKYLLRANLDIGIPIVNWLSTLTREIPHSVLPLALCFQSAITENACIEFYWRFSGRDDERFNRTMLPVLFGQYPAGFNMKQPIHYIQVFTSDRFSFFDYGPQENQRLYGSRLPPEYPLEQITAPIALHYGLNDQLSRPRDIRHLASRLSSVVYDRLYPQKQWNHVDFVYGTDAREVVYKGIVQLLRNWEGGWY